MHRPRTVVLGAGIAGAATAYFLARRGEHDVLVLDQDTVAGRHSTGRNAAILRTGMPDPVLHRLAVESAAWYADAPEGFTDGPLFDAVGLILACTADGLEAFRAWTSRPECLSGARPISETEIRARLPLLGRAAIEEAWFVEGEGVLDVHAIHQGFLQGARAAGAQVVLASRAEALEAASGRVRGVRAGGETIPADQVVLATGGWGGRLAAAIGLPLELVPRRRHLLVTARDPRIDPRWPVLWSSGDAFYCRPESGGMLLCACDASEVPPEEGERTDAGVLDLLAEKTARWLPDLADAGIGSFWAGMRTFAADDRFVIGPDPRVEGLHWVAGLGGHGITCGAAVGRLAAAWLSGVAPADATARPLLPDRLLSPQPAPA